MAFYLGQTVDQIDKLIPKFRQVFDRKRRLEAEPEAVAIRTEAGFTHVDDVQLFYQSGDRQPPRDEYNDVQLFWHFLDERLIFLSVQYTQFEPRAI
ncbi:MAG: hypothetical protein ACXW18_01875 [Pyrinomonadaceae bacterium]